MTTAQQPSIQHLLQTLCPDGVPYATLGEVCKTLSAPKKLDKRDYLQHGAYPIIDQGQKFIIAYTDDATAIVPKGEYIIFGDHTREIKFVDFPFAQGADGVKILLAKEGITPKYLYYAMSNLQIPSRGYNRHWSIAKDLPIPLPPLPIQERIVEILDKFSRLSAELEAELELRKKQYDFYRNRLLSFDSISDTVQWMPLDEVFELRNGYTPSKSNPAFWEGGTIPWYRMEDIRKNGRILSDSMQHITPAAIKGKGLFDAGSFILATTATIGEHALLIADSLANQQFTNLKIRKSLKDSLLTKFVFYYMFVVDDFCKKHTNKSGFESVDMEALKNMPFPLPPLPVQERIVGILDKFETLVSDLSQGLPAEINLVQKQYEYYRDLLLRF